MEFRKSHNHRIHCLHQKKFRYTFKKRLNANCMKGFTPTWSSKVETEFQERVEERKEEENGNVRWRVKDFQGAYHVTRIESKLPIAGSAIQLERLRVSAAATKHARQNTTMEQLQNTFEASSKGQVALEASMIKFKFNPTNYVYDNIEKIISDRENELETINKRFNREKQAFSAGCPISTLRLFEVVDINDIKSAQDMLSRGLVDPNAVGAFNNGRTCLMEACSRSRITMIECLLKFGADPNQKDASGTGTLQCMWELYMAEPKCNQLRKKVHLQNIHSILTCLLDFGVGLGMKGSDGNTALHTAVAQKSPELCWLILQRGDVSLLDEKNNAGHIPLDCAPDKNDDSFKLVLNWRKFVSANKLTEFSKEWFKFINNPQPGPGLAINFHAQKVLDGFQMAEWSSESTHIFKKQLALRQEEDTRQNNIKYKTKSESKEVGNKVVIADAVKRAQVQYTPLYRSRIDSQRKKMKPSERKLTLVEYLVGTETREKAVIVDQARKVRGQHQKLAVRRLGTAQSILNDNFKGRPRVIHPSSETTLIRPWTSSVVARPGASVRPNILAKVANDSLNDSASSNTLHTTAQYYAKRVSNTKTDEKQSKGVAPKTGVDAFKPLRRGTFSTADLNLGATKTMGTTPEKVLFVNERRNAVKQTKSDIQTCTKNISELNFENDIKVKSQARKSTSSTGTVMNPTLLPPSYNEHELYSSLRYQNTGLRGKFGRLEIAEALTIAVRRTQAGVIPKCIVDAILNSIDDNESSPGGLVSINDLKEKFANFVVNKVPIDVGPVLGILDEGLKAGHKLEMLHPSLDEFIHLNGNYPQRPGPFDSRPSVSEPWCEPSNITFKLAKYKSSDENPNITKYIKTSNHF